jgi:plasmid maintenance system antidote protein VapI
MASSLGGQLQKNRNARATESRILLARVKALGVRKSAALADVDAGHLTRLVNGNRELTRVMLAKLDRAFGIKT